MTPEQLFTAISTFGLATVLLVGLLYGLYRLGRGALESVIIPMANAHIHFLNVTCLNMEKMSVGLDGLNSKLDTVCMARPDSAEKRARHEAEMEAIKATRHAVRDTHQAVVNHHSLVDQMIGLKRTNIDATGSQISITPAPAPANQEKADE